MPGDHARLTALVRIDVVDSSGTLARSGLSAALDQRQRLSDMVQSSLAADHASDGEGDGAGADADVDAGVRVLTTEGDGATLGCASVVSALTLATALRDASLHQPFDVRLGVTLGDVITGQPSEPEGEAPVPTSPGDDLARAGAIEGYAEPHSIVVDDRVGRAIRGVAEFALGPVRTTERGDIRQLEAMTPPATPTELAAVVFTRGHVLEGAATNDVLAELVARSASIATAAGGRILDTNDTGHVVAFPSCTGALTAAAELHGATASANLRANPTPTTTAFTVSVALGELVIGDDEFGGAIIEAARLLQRGQPNTTTMTGDVAAIAGPVAESSIHVELANLKGIPEPIEVRRIAATAAPPPILDLPTAFVRQQRFACTGRDEPLALLHGAWADVLAGRGRGVIVTGEEGAGKTRLVREFARTAWAEGAIVLLGACDEDLRAPYASVAEALRRAAPIDDEIAWATDPSSVQDTGASGSAIDLPSQSPDVSAGALGRVLLAGTDLGPARQTEMPVIDRFDLFAAATRSLARLAQQRPVVLVLDDIQWATPESLQLIDHALSDPELGRVLVIATCRAEDFDRSSAVQQLAQSARPLHRTTQIRLDRLSIDDVTRLLQSRTGAPLDAAATDFAQYVTDLTGGSPLFIEELLVHLAGTGVLVQDPVDGWQLTIDTGEIRVPDSIVGLMSSRVSRLGADAVRVLTTAAVIGTSFDLALLATVGETSLDDVLDVVEAAETARLVAEDERGGTCAFADEITRQALLEDLRPSRRALVHRKVGEALEAAFPSRIDELAFHWESAIGDGTTERAIHYLRATADRDMASAAWESAIDRLHRALALLDRDSSTDDQVRGEVTYALGASQRMIGNDSHRSHLVAAAGHARAIRDGDLLGRCAIGMMRPGAWYPEAAIVDREISEMCEDSLKLLEPDDPIRPRVLAALATNLAYDPDADRRRALVEEAQRLAREQGHLAAIGTTLAAELITSYEPDRYERRWLLANEIRGIARQIGDRDLAFTGGLFALLEHICRGELDTAAELSAELRAVAETHGYWQQFLSAHFETAMAVARCAPNAEQLIEEERSRFEAHPVDWFGVSVIQSAVLAMSRGTLADMLMPFASAMEGEVDDWAKKWNYAFAKAYLDNGDLEASVELIEANRDPDFDHYWLSSVHNLGLLGLVLDRPDYCELTIERLTPYRGRFIIIGLGAVISGQVSTALGQANLGLGRLDQAEELFREALDQADAAGFPYYATAARRFLATTLLQRDPGDPEGLQQLERAAADATRLGFALELTALTELRAGAVTPG